MTGIVLAGNVRTFSYLLMMGIIRQPMLFYNKLMFYYSISILILAIIKDFNIIAVDNEIEEYSK